MQINPKKYILLLAGLLGCSVSSPTSLIPPTSPSPSTPIISYKTQNKVLLLGIDGVRPDALQKADTPNIDCLTKSYSYRALADPPTWSAHGWSDVLTGVKADKHGVTENTFKNSNYEQYPSFFTRIEEERPELYTVSIDSWKLNEKINTAVDKAIWHSYKDNGDRINTDYAKGILSLENPDVIFLYYADPDVAGHDYGFHPDIPEYIAEIEEVDSQIGEVLAVLEDRSENEDWLIIAITDHGGDRGGHGGDSLEERTIFYLSNKEDGEILPVPAQVDVAPTILRYLNIEIKNEWGLDGRVLNGK